VPTALQIDCNVRAKPGDMVISAGPPKILIDLRDFTDRQRTSPATDHRA
jgi:hypothetical protein